MKSAPLIFDSHVYVPSPKELKRKERNKISAARSRANRKALMAQMQATIDELRAENDALKAQLSDLSMPDPMQSSQSTLESAGSWIDKFAEPALRPKADLCADHDDMDINNLTPDHNLTPDLDSVAEQGGFYDDDLT